jgi:hypothetical protein
LHFYFLTGIVRGHAPTKKVSGSRFDQAALGNSESGRKFILALTERWQLYANLFERCTASGTGELKCLLQVQLPFSDLPEQPKTLLALGACCDGEGHKLLSEAKTGMLRPLVASTESVVESVKS